MEEKMAYNVTLLTEASNIAEYGAFFAIESSGWFWPLLILGMIIIVSIVAILNNMRETKAIFFALALSMIPTILFSTLEGFGTPWIEPWFVLLHLTLLAVFAAFAYLGKN